ncbi:hypothetical protein [Williamsia sp. Leaf354]|uniref:hypothetical protein n=1 Tax=Williamsia sp. Leaf354 TaxID=1736349 RepID=UPI000AABC984|nr:hypothetical protein [Williamsia sp. Leaf354]
MAMPDVSVDWLLDADPTLRWQVERDVVGAPSAVWEATRARRAPRGERTVGVRRCAVLGW